MATMKIIPVFPKGFAANSYLVTADGANAVAIDPGQARVLQEAKKLGLAVKYILLTHGHFDHIVGCAALQAAGAKVGCLYAEKALALSNDNMGAFFGVPVPPFQVDFTFRDGELLSLCGIAFEVKATPGHTAGSCCFLTENEIFTGDTLFAGDRGRTDLPTGSEAAMQESLRLLAGLQNRTVYPGHGSATTLEEEKLYGILRF